MENIIALSLATDEKTRRGINETKRVRLIKSGAHAISGGFSAKDEILAWLGL